VAVGVASASMNVYFNILSCSEETEKEGNSEQRLVTTTLHASTIFTTVMGVFQGTISIAILMVGKVVNFKKLKLKFLRLTSFFN